MGTAESLRAWCEQNRQVVLFAILVIALFLRLQQISQPFIDEYSWREADTASMADGFASGSWNIFQPQVRWGGSGPNHIGAEFQTVSFMAALGYQVVGSAPWVGRLVSVAFGVWGLFAFCQLLRRVWSTPAALTATAVLAVMPGAVFIDRSFLSDGAMTALMTTSLWWFVAWCQSRRFPYLVGAVIAGALGCLTKITGGILILPALYAAYSLLGHRLHERSTRLYLLVAAMLVALPVCSYYLWARHLAASAAPFHFTGGGKFVWSGEFAEWLKNDYYLPQFWHLICSDLWGLPLICLATLGLCVRPEAQQPNGARWLMHVWLIAMLIRYLVEARHLVTDPYNVHLFNPVVAAFAGAGLSRLLAIAAGMRLPRPRAALGLLLFSGVALAGTAIGGRWHAGEPWSEPYSDHYVLARRLAELSSPNDLVISFGLEPVVLYHSDRHGWVFPPEEIATMKPGAAAHKSDYGPSDLANLRQLSMQGARWLVIPSFNSYLPAERSERLRSDYPELFAGIFNDFELVSEQPDGLIFRIK